MYLKALCNLNNPWLLYNLIDSSQVDNPLNLPDVLVVHFYVLSLFSLSRLFEDSDVNKLLLYETFGDFEPIGG